MQVQNANMEGGMLEMYTSPADLRKQQVADLQAKRQEKVRVQHRLFAISHCLPHGSSATFCAVHLNACIVVVEWACTVCVCMHESCCVVKRKLLRSLCTCEI